MTAIYLPDTGSNHALDVIDILVNVGDAISVDQPLLTLESDKATLDVPAPSAGTLKTLHVKVGDKIKTGDLIAEFDSADATATTPTASPEVIAPQETAAAPAAPVSPVSPSSEAFVFQLPDTGSPQAVSVIELNVAIGAAIQKGDTLCILESDKATMDVPSPVDGVLQQWLLKVGDKVQSGADVARLLATTPTQTPVTKPAAAKPTTAKSAVAEPTTAKPTTATQPAAIVTTSNSIKAPLATPTEQTHASSTDTLYAGPSVRRMARLLGVDLHKVKGTGEKNRITKDDIRQHVKALVTQAQQAPANQNNGLGLPTMPFIDFSQYGPIETKPLSRIKKLTAQNLSRNWLLAPHVTQFEEADITELEAFRKSQSAAYDKQGIKLTPLIFIMKAVVGALQAAPTFNASLDERGENLILKNYFHIGIAVDTPEGLVVPVIRDVDQKSLSQLAQELAEISGKARNKKLTAQDMQGSCFTISSLGGIGGTGFTPIINLPNVAILGVAKSAVKPHWDGQQFVPRLMLPLSLSYDHRVIDGAEAARFIVTIAKYLHDIRLLLL